VTVVIPIVSEFQGKGFKQAETSTQKLTKSLKNLAVTLGLALSTRKIVQFGKASVLAASDLEEAVSKASVVFGRGSAQIEEFGRTSATALGISSAAAIEAAGTYGNLLQAFGIGQAQAQGMSTTLVQLAADMASFNNTPIDQAITALRSGLSGETEPLKRYGVALQDVRLKTEALRLGLIKSTKEALTPGAKAQAAYELILKDTVLAQGDFARTSSGVANSLKILAASATNAQTIIGTKLIQSMDLLIDRKDGVETLAKSFEDMGTYVGNVALGLAEIGKSLKTLFGLLPGGGFSGRDLLQGIPVIGSYIELIQKLGEKSSAAKETKQAMLTRALAKEQGKLASRNFTIQKKTTAELTKQNKLKKDNNKLDKAGSMLDLEKIQIEAALQGELTDNERLRLQLMKALVNENADRAEYLAKELEKSQNSIAKLKNSLTEFKPSSPFDEWLDAIERMRTMLAGIGVSGMGMPQAPMSPSVGSPTLSTDLGAGYIDDIFTRDKTTGQTTVNVNVTGTGGLDAETKKAVVDAVVEASSNGYSTGWFRTTGSAIATF
jgi:hypothetical protein